MSGVMHSRPMAFVWLGLTLFLVGAMAWRWLTGTTRSADGSRLQDHATEHLSRTVGQMGTPWQRLPLGKPGTMLLIGAFAALMLYRIGDRIAHPEHRASQAAPAPAAETAPSDSHIDSNSKGAF